MLPKKIILPGQTCSQHRKSYKSLLIGHSKEKGKTRLSIDIKKVKKIQHNMTECCQVGKEYFPRPKENRKSEYKSKK